LNGHSFFELVDGFASFVCCSAETEGASKLRAKLRARGHEKSIETQHCHRRFTLC
jgi:hypothetical protein